MIIRSGIFALLLLVFWSPGLRPVESLADGGGDLTLPVDPTVFQTSVNSFFDHHLPGPYDTWEYLPYVRWDNWSRNNIDTLLSYPCSISQGKCYNGHEGIDFNTGGQYGIPIIASAKGTVTYVGTFGDWGRTIRVWHADKGISTRYSHLNGYAVANGQSVQRGELLGYSGCSGLCYGAHLDFGLYDSPTGGTYYDPFGWVQADSTSDPSPSPYGHTWATRIGSLNSSGIAVKEGTLSAAWGDITPLPGSGTVTAMSIDGSRIGLVRGGTAYARDTSINTPNRPASNGWLTMYTNAIDIKLAGNRVGVVRSDYKLVMKEGPLNAYWYENVADNVWKVVLTPDRIGVLHLDGSFKMKDHGPINGPWYVMMGTNQVKDIALTDEWIGAATVQIGCMDCFKAKDTLYGEWQVMLSSGVVSITMGGQGADRRMGAVAGGGQAKEWSLNATWMPLGAAVEVALNSGRAARRQSNGNIYVSEGEDLGLIGGGVVGNGSGVRLN